MKDLPPGFTVVAALCNIGHTVPSTALVALSWRYTATAALPALTKANG
jgi:hypothetical protein